MLDYSILKNSSTYSKIYYFTKNVFYLIFSSSLCYGHVNYYQICVRFIYSDLSLYLIEMVGFLFLKFSTAYYYNDYIIRIS